MLVKRFLVDPVTHEADSAQSPISKMDHHVLHVQRDQRVPVLVDLASAPGRTMVFTRTKHGAKALARQLNARGVPTVELHGNLAQNARTRNMEAFHSGKATTLVATDIAARGIHVDDVALVVHADPPAEHKAYLHRSGRTARAGAAGTVITLMTDQQVARRPGADPRGRHPPDHHEGLWPWPRDPAHRSRRASGSSLPVGSARRRPRSPVAPAVAATVAAGPVRRPVVVVAARATRPPRSPEAAGRGAVVPAAARAGATAAAGTAPRRSAARADIAPRVARWVHDWADGGPQPA